MKFFLNVTLISSCLFLNLAYPCDAQDILEPSHLLSYQYSKPHSPQPKSVDPNIAYSTWETPSVKCGMNDLSISLLKHLYSMKADAQHAYVYDPYSQHLLKYEHFQNYKSESTNHDSDVGYLLAKHYIGIWLPIQYGNSNWLSNVNSFGNLAFNKTKTFIETKVTAMKLQGFNL